MGKRDNHDISTTKIVLVYIGVGFLWIAFSDTILYNVTTNAELYNQFQTLKGAFYVVVTAVLLYFLIRRELKRRKIIQQELERALEEKEYLLKELNHRVRNSLQIALSIFNMQIHEVEENKKAYAILQRTRSRLQTISSCVDALYNSPSFSNIPLASYLEKVAYDTVDSFRRDGFDISFSSDSAEVDRPLETAVPLGLIVNELVENSVLHASDGQGKTKSSRQIEIYLRVTPGSNGEEVSVSVGDNGPGFSSYNENGEGGIGYALIDALVNQIDGHLSISPSPNERGSVVTVTGE